MHRSFDLRNLVNPFVSYYLQFLIFVYGGFVGYHLVYKDEFNITFTSQLLLFYGIIVTTLVGIVLNKYYFKNQFISRNSVVIIDSPDHIVNNIFFILSFLLFLAFLKLSGFNPLKATDLGLERVKMQAGYGYLKITSQIFAYVSVPPLLFSKKNSKFYKLIIFVVTIAIFLGFGYRSQVLNFLLILFTIYYMVRPKEIKFKTFIIYGAALYFLLLLLGAIRAGVDANLIDLMNAQIAWRPFVTFLNMDTVISHYSNAEVSFLYGQSILFDLSTLIPGSWGPGSSLTYYNSVTNSMEAGGTITPTLIAILYSNLGIVGVILIMPMVPIPLMYIGYRWQRKNVITIDRLNLYVFISFALWGIIIVGFVLPFIYNIIPFLLFFYLKIFVRYALVYISQK